MFRPAVSADRSAVSALWQQVFDDSTEFVQLFFDAFPNCPTFVVEEQGQVLAMVHALPQILQLTEAHPAAYIYAVATHPEARGKGLCRGLMAFAEQALAKSGITCTVLTPFEPSLFQFYATMGYTASFIRRHTLWNGQGEEITAAEYLRLRETLLPCPHMVYGEAEGKLLTQDGVRFYRTASGCAAARPEGAVECLPEDLGGEPASMVKWLGQSREFSAGYLGFSLD